MINATSLKDDLKKQVLALEKDLHQRLKNEPAFAEPLREKYDIAFASRRTAATFIAWAENEITQAAVAWVLATVFIRFLEDNGLIPDPILSGPPERLRLAQDALSHHFMQRPGDSERDYLLHHFSTLRQYPALTELLGPHNALHALHPTPDVLKGLIAFWRQIDPASDNVKHDFTDPEMRTRFLGDLYQDLSEAARKTYALLQTPDFIEEFILDRTLTPAIQEFGLKEVRMIDPTCGSGHFLLGSFRRLFALWVKAVPTTREATVNALKAVHGVDLNPFAIAISRFRLIIEACHACGERRLANAPDFEINLATGDALLHGRRFRDFERSAGIQPTLTGSEDLSFRDELRHHYEVEDGEALHCILGQQYHAVVGNPPYITVKDRAVSELYRARYPSCHRVYSLSVPFMERFFDLAVKGDATPQQPAGFVGQITANSFMKREFGKKLIEEYLPRWDLTHVLDTSGAYIPGHGTPTVILFGKNQPPISSTIRTVLGICGEPATPQDPAKGVVWLSILHQIDEPGSVSTWMSASDSPRANFHKHPWSIGGGGAAELKEKLDEECKKTLGAYAEWPIGRAVRIGNEEVFIFDKPRQHHSRAPSEQFRDYLIGDSVRDWVGNCETTLWYPYCPAARGSDMIRQLWGWRTPLRGRVTFQGDMGESGAPWYHYQQHTASAYARPLSIAFAFVATHNHFVLDRGGRVFNRSAPVIKLNPGAQEEDHVRLLGPLNSSTACFWMKQVFHNKGSTVDSQGARQRTAAFEDFYEHDGGKLTSFPIPSYLPQQLPTALVRFSTAMQSQSPAATLARWDGRPVGTGLRERLLSARDLAAIHRGKLIAWQEELDWQIYEAFGLVEPTDNVSLPEGEAMDAIPLDGLRLGERAFEIVLARRMAAGEVQTTWFERHESTPITELPHAWPAEYRDLVERRIRRIADDSNIRLIEQPEYKRRWNTESWDEQLKSAAKNWLLARLETYAFDSERMEGAHATSDLRSTWPAGQASVIFTQAQIVAVAESDEALKAVMEAYTGTPTFDLNRQIKALLEEGRVPYLPMLRYKESGLRKRRAWEEVWQLQRKEDAIEAEVMARLDRVTDEVASFFAEDAKAEEDRDPEKWRGSARTIAKQQLDAELKQRLASEVGVIPVPPKYASGDFKKSHWWAQRGKLDVPKERWVSYPGLETTSAPSPLYAWAGWDHLQQAQALSALYVQRKTTDGWNAPQLTPILAGLQELVPWLQQWHNEEDPNFGMRLGDYFAGFVADERRALGLTQEDVDKVRLG